MLEFYVHRLRSLARLRFQIDDALIDKRGISDRSNTEDEIYNIIEADFSDLSDQLFVFFLIVAQNVGNEYEISISKIAKNSISIQKYARKFGRKSIEGL